jgi:hypothetical protein
LHELLVNQWNEHYSHLIIIPQNKSTLSSSSKQGMGTTKTERERVSFTHNCHTSSISITQDQRNQVTIYETEIPHTTDVLPVNRKVSSKGKFIQPQQYDERQTEVRCVKELGISNICVSTLTFWIAQYVLWIRPKYITDKEMKSRKPYSCLTKISNFCSW